MAKGAQFSVLSVDDDPRIRQTLSRYLTEHGFAVRQVGSSQDALQVLRLRSVDLVLVDVVLGRDSGLELARVIRSTWPHIGIIMVTARDDTIDRVIGLESGADDYIVKPFNLREVLARINSLLRRVALQPRRTAGDSSNTVLQFEGWSLDISQRQLLTAKDGEIALTAGEFNLLAALASRPGHVFAREYLVELTNGHNWHPFDRTVDARIARLRKKIEMNPRQPKIIKAVRGVGYVLAARIINA